MTRYGRRVAGAGCRRRPRSASRNRTKRGWSTAATDVSRSSTRLRTDERRRSPGDSASRERAGERAGARDRPHVTPRARRPRASRKAPRRPSAWELADASNADTLGSLGVRSRVLVRREYYPGEPRTDRVRIGELTRKKCFGRLVPHEALSSTKREASVETRPDSLRHLHAQSTRTFGAAVPP